MPFPCRHLSLVADCPSAGRDGYVQPEWARRVAATTPSGRMPKDAPQQESETHRLTFPAPLALPADDLSLDPAYPPQSLRSWASLKERNKVTPDRKTIYVARPPHIPPDVSFMTAWATPTPSAKDKAKKKTVPAQAGVQHPRLFDDTVEYLRAFYHGLQVKEHSPDLCFQLWDALSSSQTSKARPLSAVALQETPTPSCTRIRVRPSPDGLFLYQLHLDDLLDAAIQLLPEDAYAFLLLVDQDLYEDDFDDFCCGRAYGGSRVAVVSSARYNPVLHAAEAVDREHMWPASHCQKYVSLLLDTCSEDLAGKSSHLTKGSVTNTNNREEEESSSPSHMHMAVAAFQAARSSESEHLYGLWLFCVARTASHELGHCFGMDHCVYYACMMQGTASVAEDCRQPPYLCPICAAKLARAVREGSARQDLDEKQYTWEAVEAVTRFCEKRKLVGVWAGYEAWLRCVLAT